LLYAITLHFIGGTIVGSAFAVGTLIALLSFELVSAMVLAAAYGFVPWTSWFLILAALQVGYLAGAFVRGSLEYGSEKPAVRNSGNL
jgi:hypothetical protein